MMKQTFQGSLLFLASLTTLIAQTTLPARSEYVAKFVCGVSSIPTQGPPSEPAVKRGNYATVVNLHNPNNQNVIIKKRISLGAPERYQSTPPLLSLRLRNELRIHFRLITRCMSIAPKS